MAEDERKSVVQSDSDAINDGQTNTNAATITTTTTDPPHERRMSHSHSISMRDWNHKTRSMTLYDVQTMLGVDPINDSTNEYSKVNAHLQTQLNTYNGPNPFIKVLPFSMYEKFKIFFFSNLRIAIN